MRINLRIHKSDSGRRRNRAGGEMVHGVPQEQIDKLRGTRDHADAFSMKWEDIKKDYEQVGIKISDQYAQEVEQIINRFTMSDYLFMRNAVLKERAGEQLTSQDMQWISKYKKCEEYTKIAPTYACLEKEIYRGVYVSEYVLDSQKYLDNLQSLKVGDKWNADKMPTSFTTDLTRAKDFANMGKQGTIIHIASGSLKNSPSIRGLSSFSSEMEVLVGDYNFTVVNVIPAIKSKDKIHHIYVK